MIGLVDLALQSQSNLELCPPNLEIMKLASYYQAEENIFCRLVGLDETELTGYEKIYIFSEFKEYTDVPEAFRRASNVIYGGSAFTNGIYVPFKNSLIDHTLARTFIYKDLLKDKMAQGADINAIGHLLDDSYYRMMVNDQKLPIPPIIPRKRVYLYDRNIFTPDWKDTFEKILSHVPSSIYTIHPVFCKTINQFIDLYSFSRFSRQNQIILDMNIPLNEVKYLMEYYKKKLLELIIPASNVAISLGGNFKTKIQYEKDFIYKMKLFYAFWSQHIPIKLVYTEPNIKKNPLENLSQAIVEWSHNGYRNKRNIFERIPKGKKTSPSIEKQEMEYMMNKYPKTKTLFYQTYETVQEGGKWL